MLPFNFLQSNNAERTLPFENTQWKRIKPSNTCTKYIWKRVSYVKSFLKDSKYSLQAPFHALNGKSAVLLNRSMFLLTGPIYWNRRQWNHDTQEYSVIIQKASPSSARMRKVWAGEIYNIHYIKYKEKPYTGYENFWRKRKKKKKGKKKRQWPLYYCGSLVVLCSLEKQIGCCCATGFFSQLSAFGKTDLNKKIFAFREISYLISLYQLISVALCGSISVDVLRFQVIPSIV